MKVGNAVVASQKQSPPDHRADAAQDDLELVNAQHLGAWHGAQSYRHRLPCRKRFSQIRSTRTSTRFFMLSNYVWLLMVFPVAVAILVGVLGHSVIHLLSEPLIATSIVLPLVAGFH